MKTPKAKKVLVVDDSEMSRLLLRVMLEKLGFAVEVADSAATAVAAARRTHYAAILMDYQMPDIDGVTCTKLIKKQPFFHDFPSLVIVASADHSPETKTKFEELDMNAYLEKPFTFEQLQATLKDLNCVV